MRQVSSAGRVRSAILLYASIFMFMRIILVATAGKQSAAYAGPALELCLLFLVTIPYAVSVCLSRLIKSRMRRQRYSSIRILYKTALLFSIAAGLIAGGLTAVLNAPLSLLLGGEAHMYLCFLCAAPFFVITSAFGAFGGFYQGVRITPPAITSILAEAVLTCILSPAVCQSPEAERRTRRGTAAG
jgi:Na+-driven multidrug efflux pump